MPDLFGKKQLGRTSSGGRFYATPSERVEAGAVYFPDESSLLFGVAEYTVEAGNLGAFATEGTFFFERPDDWLDSLGRKVFFRPSTGEIVNQDQKGDVLIGFQVLANVPDDKLGVVLTQGENSVVIIVTSTADSGAGSLRQAIADAQDGDAILFDSDVFPAGQTTSILLSSYISINKSISIYGGFSDGAGGYTSGAVKRFYVYREIEGVKTKTYIDDDNPAQEGETVLFDLVCRVALDGQGAVECMRSTNPNAILVNISGLCLLNGNAPNGGGLYSIGASRNTLTDCAILNCSATTYGGGFFSTNTSQNTLNDCTITGCNAPNGGGGYLYSASQNTLNSCVFDDCSATNGGGLYSYNTSQNTLNDCVITNCSASNGGGVYSGNTGQNTLNACVFDGCSAASGGGMYSRDTSQNTLNGCTISNCSATSNGGGVYSNNTSQNTLYDCIFDGCSASNGGALYTSSSSQNTLNNCTFSTCTATTSGGAFYVSGNGQNVLNACSFDTCTATTSGGAFFTSSTSQSTLNDCIITNCSATNGGAIFSSNESQNTLNNCEIKDCAASSYGGAIYSYFTSKFILNNCNISSCTATPSGGAFYAGGSSNVELSDCTITDNTNNDFAMYSAATLTIASGVSIVGIAMIPSSVTITIADGAALTITDAATINAATFTSDGRGYLAVAAGIDISSATLTGVVACTYGAGLESFDINADGATWTADDLTTPILLEEKGDGDVWTTLSDDATGGSYSDSFEIGTTLRAFDGVRFFLASLDAYWQVEPFVVASNGGGGAGDDSPSWTVQDATITPNAEEV